LDEIVGAAPMTDAEPERADRALGPDGRVEPRVDVLSV
jgi:hypothetical protein